MGITVEIRCPSCKRTATYDCATRQPFDGEWSVCQFCHCAIVYSAQLVPIPFDFSPEVLSPSECTIQCAPLGWQVPAPDVEIPPAVDRWRQRFRVLERLQALTNRLKGRGGAEG